MKRSHTIQTDENDKQSGRSSRASRRMQRWSLALRRHWFSLASGRSQESTDCDFNTTNSLKIIFATSEKAALVSSLNGLSFSNLFPVQFTNEY